jgi:hypothetical protein
MPNISQTSRSNQSAELNKDFIEVKAIEFLIKVLIKILILYTKLQKE